MYRVFERSGRFEKEPGVDCVIREIRPEEIFILRDLLYKAIYRPEGAEPVDRSVLEVPEIGAYIDGYGKMDDHCLVAEIEGNIVGAVWVRILAGDVKGYGNIDEKTPEFAISLFPAYRGRGIGTVLMKRMIADLRKKGYARASLSVDKRNPAVNLYRKVGLRIVRENTDDYLMAIDLQDHA